MQGKTSQKRVIIIGAGAAGFFSAIAIKEQHPDHDVIILEKTNKPLSKVKISGGGRCNVTNACAIPSELVKSYPRGGKKLRKLFEQFNTMDTVEWFARKGVKLKTEPDGRMFPVTDDSQTIIDCFLREAHRLQVQVRYKSPVTALLKNNNHFEVQTSGQEAYEAETVLVCTGNLPSVWDLLSRMGVGIAPPVPSLFTFNISDGRLDALPGIAFENVRCRIAASKFESEGPLLITHWGLSGPAILKLSAFAARELHQRSYRFDLLINFCPAKHPEEVKSDLRSYAMEHPRQRIHKHLPVDLPRRYWERICQTAEIPAEHSWGDAGKKHFNRLTEELTNARFSVSGKSTFKDEFVTAGGVKLSEVDLQTMACKKIPGLYFAGEVLDIDGITGGYNFQAAWSTAYVAATGPNL